VAHEGQTLLMSESLTHADALARRSGHGRREEDARNERLARLLVQVTEGIICVDRNWMVTFANEEACYRSRITPADIGGARTYWEIYPHLIGTELEQFYRNVMRTGEKAHVEYYSERIDAWLDVTVYPTDEGIALFYHDVTDRKGAELLRDASVRQLRQVLETTTDSVASIDRNWNISFLNRRAKELLSPKGELLGKNLWQEFPVAEQNEEVRRYLIRAMDEGVPGEFETFYPDPLNLWLSIQCRPFEDGIVLFFRDVTAERVSRQILLNQQATLAFVQETARVATWEMDLVNRTVKFGEGSYPVYGQPFSELTTIDDLDKIIRPSDLVHVQQDAKRAIDTNTVSIVDYEVFTPEGGTLWVECRRVPVYNSAGVATHLRGMTTDITRRRQADTILKQQRDLLTSVQQTALVATWEIEYGTGKVTYGVGSYPVFGHPLEEVPDYRSFKKIVLPEYIPIIAASIQAGVQTGGLTAQEFQVRAADGRILWLESRGHAVMVDGVPTCLRGLTIDITARKKNEEALVASEARYRVLTDLNPQGIWLGDPAGNVTYANQGLLDYLGFAIEDLAAQGWLNGFHPNDRERVLESWSRSVSSGEDYDIEARMVRAHDGRARWWWIRAQPVRDESGKILDWLGVAIDIDDRRTFAETLQRRQDETERQRAELETIYQTAPIGLALFDPVEFRYLRINDRQCETLGLPREKILGRPITEIAPLKGLKEIFEQVAKGHVVRNLLLEGELPTRPGEHRFWNVSYSPIFNTDGIVEAIAAVILEVTTQKKAEAALIQSEKLAAVGRLASSISHEINNPLEAITNLLYLIALSGDLPEGIKSYVQIAQSELSRVCQIATQTLRFHRQAVRATYVSAADLVDAVLDLYHGRLANSGIHVDATYSTDTTVLCFENDIRQVLNNLIANALDAMRQGGGILRVRAHDATDYSAQFPEGRRGIRITIADSGHGMPPPVRARLFEPFYTTKDLNGTGLGLWISAGIVDRHHGRLIFRSTEHPIHHGTVFSLFLPRVEEHLVESH
jgi:PAS domain S-box-containing protein